MAPTPAQQTSNMAAPTSPAANPLPSGGGSPSSSDASLVATTGMQTGQTQTGAHGQPTLSRPAPRNTPLPVLGVLKAGARSQSARMLTSMRPLAPHPPPPQAQTSKPAAGATRNRRKAGVGKTGASSAGAAETKTTHKPSSNEDQDAVTTATPHEGQAVSPSRTTKDAAVKQLASQPPSRQPSPATNDAAATTTAPTLLERLYAWRAARARGLRVGPASLVANSVLTDVALMQPLSFLALQEGLQGLPSARLHELGHEIIDIVRTWVFSSNTAAGAGGKKALLLDGADKDKPRAGPVTNATSPTSPSAAGNAMTGSCAVGKHRASAGADGGSGADTQGAGAGVAAAAGGCAALVGAQSNCSSGAGEGVGTWGEMRSGGGAAVVPSGSTATQQAAGCRPAAPSRGASAAQLSPLAGSSSCSLTAPAGLASDCSGGASQSALVAPDTVFVAANQNSNASSTDSATAASAVARGCGGGIAAAALAAAGSMTATATNITWPASQAGAAAATALAGTGSVTAAAMDIVWPALKPVAVTTIATATATCKTAAGAGAKDQQGGQGEAGQFDLDAFFSPPSPPPPTSPAAFDIDAFFAPPPPPARPAGPAATGGAAAGVKAGVSKGGVSKASAAASKAAPVGVVASPGRKPVPSFTAGLATARASQAHQAASTHQASTHQVSTHQVASTHQADPSHAMDNGAEDEGGQDNGAAAHGTDTDGITGTPFTCGGNSQGRGEPARTPGSGRAPPPTLFSASPTRQAVEQWSKLVSPPGQVVDDVAAWRQVCECKPTSSSSPALPAALRPRPGGQDGCAANDSLASDNEAVSCGGVAGMAAALPAAHATTTAVATTPSGKAGSRHADCTRADAVCSGVTNAGANTGAGTAMGEARDAAGTDGGRFDLDAFFSPPPPSPPASAFDVDAFFSPPPAPLRSVPSAAAAVRRSHAAAGAAALQYIRQHQRSEAGMADVADEAGEEDWASVDAIPGSVAYGGKRSGSGGRSSGGVRRGGSGSLSRLPRDAHPWGLDPSEVLLLLQQYGCSESVFSLPDRSPTQRESAPAAPQAPHAASASGSPAAAAPTCSSSGLDGGRGAGGVNDDSPMARNSGGEHSSSAASCGAAPLVTPDADDQLADHVPHPVPAAGGGDAACAAQPGKAAAVADAGSPASPGRARTLRSSKAGVVPEAGGGTASPTSSPQKGGGSASPAATPQKGGGTASPAATPQASPASTPQAGKAGRRAGVGGRNDPLLRERTKYCVQEDVWIIQQACACATLGATALAIRRSPTAVKRRLRSLLLPHPRQHTPGGRGATLNDVTLASRRRQPSANLPLDVRHSLLEALHSCPSPASPHSKPHPWAAAASRVAAMQLQQAPLPGTPHSRPDTQSPLAPQAQSMATPQAQAAAGSSPAEQPESHTPLAAPPSQLPADAPAPPAAGGAGSGPADNPAGPADVPRGGDVGVGGGAAAGMCVDEDGDGVARGPPWDPNAGVLWPPLPRKRRRRPARDTDTGSDQDQPGGEDGGGDDASGGANKRRRRRRKPSSPSDLAWVFANGVADKELPLSDVARTGASLARARAPADFSQCTRAQLLAFLREAGEAHVLAPGVGGGGTDADMASLVAAAVAALPRWHVLRVLACKHILTGTPRHVAVLQAATAGVPPSQQDQVVRTAFRRLSLLLHPDKHMQRQLLSAGQAAASSDLAVAAAGAAGVGRQAGSGAVVKTVGPAVDEVVEAVDEAMEAFQMLREAHDMLLVTGVGDAGGN